MSPFIFSSACLLYWIWQAYRARERARALERDLMAERAVRLEVQAERDQWFDDLITSLPQMGDLTLKQLGFVAHARAVKSEFWPMGFVSERHKFEFVSGQLALIHSEISEALEALRDGRFALYLDDKDKPEGFVTELGDAVIRIADLCRGLELDLQGAIETKHAYNCTRPAKHGRKF
jgi:hypothetical protein